MADTHGDILFPAWKCLQVGLLTVRSAAADSGRNGLRTQNINNQPIGLKSLWPEGTSVSGPQSGAGVYSFDGVGRTRSTIDLFFPPSNPESAS